MSYSKICRDLATYFNTASRNCVKCVESWIKPGYEFTPNCGFTDDGGRRDGPIQKCKAQTFNDGTFTKCQPCGLCPDGHRPISQCNSTTNTQCCQSGSDCMENKPGTTSGRHHELSHRVTPSPVSPLHPTRLLVATVREINYTKQTTLSNSLWTTTTQPTTQPIRISSVPALCSFFIIVPIVLAVFFYFACYMKWVGKSAKVHKGTEETLVDTANFVELDANKTKSSDSNKIINEELSLSFENRTLADILNPQIRSAPLQTVLDDFDVLDELVILLDPEVNGVKNSRHLASRCCFSSTWITYTYSMKDSKSPLRAILEGLTSKYPDWTVGHIAQILSDLERNDAVTVLTKLNRKLCNGLIQR